MNCPPRWANPKNRYQAIGDGSLSTYTAEYGTNHPYYATNHNSNYAVNFVIYGKAQAPGGLGWAPPFAKDE